VRHDERDASGKTMCINVIADNLRLGAATNPVRIATR
jgi:aspartate-semialdehyde dehydrogenase